MACSPKKNGAGAADFPSYSISQTAFHHSGETRRIYERIQSFMDSNFKKQVFNGGLLVAYKGEVLYEYYGGFAQYRHRKDSITPSSAFHLASVSKTITAMSVLKLCEEGQVGLNDELAQYLTGFPVKGVTIKTLLNHRSGLPNYVHYMERLGWDRKKRMTNDDILQFINKRHKEIGIARPNSRFSYSNTNYALLALVIEKVTGKSFRDHIRETIFDPLGMNDSYVFSLADSARAMPSFFYSGRTYAFDYLDLVYGDKNIFSSPRDLYKFDRALSNHTLLPKTLQDSAYLPYSFERPGINNYGLGWRMQLLKNGKKIIYHNGWWHGNRTAFYRLLDEDATIIALCNNDAKKVYSTKKLADLFGNYFQSDEKDEPEENGTVQVRKRRNGKNAHRLTRHRKLLPNRADHSITAKK